MTFLDQALGYAARGWPVFPLEPGGKRPLGRLARHGLKDASTDPDVIRSWGKTEPRANIGLPTGVSFDAVDIDGPDALSALDRSLPLAALPDDDPIVVGPTVQTPRGWHCYIAPTGRGNTVNVGELAGVDWRGRGGYVVAPGSVREDGTPWAWYLADDPLYGPDAEIRPAPAWLLELLDRRSAPSSVPVPSPAVRAGSTYGQAALERALGRLAVASEGTRNHALNAEAHGLGKLVAASHLRGSEVAERLLRVALQIGLSEMEAKATIGSGLEAGKADGRVAR